MTAEQGSGRGPRREGKRLIRFFFPRNATGKEIAAAVFQLHRRVQAEKRPQANEGHGEAQQSSGESQS